jgi:hypothetical protein
VKSNDRRVVLNQTFAKNVEDVLVFYSNDLLERFLPCLMIAYKETKISQHVVLILVFEQGQERTYSIIMRFTTSIENTKEGASSG